MKRGRSLAANTLATAARIERIGAEPVDRLGGKGDDLAPRQRFGGAAMDSFVAATIGMVSGQGLVQLAYLFHFACYH